MTSSLLNTRTAQHVFQNLRLLQTRYPGQYVRELHELLSSYCQCGAACGVECTWKRNKPMVVFEKPLHSPKVTVWCSLSCNQLYGPFFFEDAQTGNACTVTTETFLGMLETVMDVDITPDIWFQQDGPTAHTSAII